MKKLSKKEIHNILIKFIYQNKRIEIFQCAICNKHFCRSYNNIFMCCDCEIKKVQGLTLEQQKEWIKEHTK